MKTFSANFQSLLRSDTYFGSTLLQLFLFPLFVVLTLGVLLISPAQAAGNKGLNRSIDFNADGKADLIFTDPNGQADIWLMNGTTVLSRTTVLQAGSGFSIAHVADLNGDGHSDLILRRNDGAVFVRLLIGTTTISTLQETMILAPTSGWSIVGVADLNGDGKLDLIGEHTSGVLGAALMDGVTFIAADVITTTGSKFRYSHTADFDNDGKDDLLLTDTNGRVVLRIMDGLRTSAESTLLSEGSGWTVTHIADLDGGGSLPVPAAPAILGRHSSGVLAAARIRGGAIVDSAIILEGSTNFFISQATDLDGDGKADLLLTDKDGNNLMLSLRDGLVSKSGATLTRLFPSVPSTRVTHFADLDGNGKPWAIARSTDGSVTAWQIAQGVASNGTLLRSAYGGRITPNTNNHRAPVARITFTPSAQPLAGSTVNFDATASSDLQQRTLTYAWTITSRPPGSRADFSNAASSKPTWVPDVAGTYSIALVVSNGTDYSETQTTSITVLPAPVPTTATYRVTFRTGWSATTFPTQFPASRHFSGLVGATHNSSVEFWDEGKLASEGIRNMAERGIQSTLLSEVTAVGTRAAQGISGGGIGSTQTEVSLDFSISQEFPLVTLVSMVAPSPDWFVSVSSLPLFEGGVWREQVNVSLEVYDAGTDDGRTFGSPDLVASPRKLISKLTTAPADTDFSNGVNRTTGEYIGTFSFQRLR